MDTNNSQQESDIHVDLALYGSIARCAGGQHIAQATVTLPPGSKMQDLFDCFGIPAAERGFVFCNAVIYDMPGLNVAGDEPLRDGDHIGIFSIDRTWPYQYRQGAPMSERVAAAMREHGALRHTYREAEASAANGGQ